LPTKLTAHSQQHSEKNFAAGDQAQANDDIDGQDDEAAVEQAEQVLIDETTIEEQDECVLENDNTIETITVENSDDGEEIDDNPESDNDDN